LRQRGDRQLAVLSECLLIGFIVFLLAGLTIDFMRIGFKNVWLMMALAPVLLRLSRDPAGAARHPRPMAEAHDSLALSSRFVIN
jgi:hypothetical protein